MRAKVVRTALLLAVGAALGACSETNLVLHAAKTAQEQPERGYYKIGKPYQIKGVWYYPAEDYDYEETGIASWYGSDFHGKETANGEIFDMNAVSAAHRTLPMPSFARVTNLDNGRSIIVRVNDRGPYAHGRIIDLSRRAAQLLGFETQGTTRVRVKIMAEESRRIAARMMGREPDPSPAPVAAPRVTVAAEILPPPGSTEAPKPVAPAPVVERAAYRPAPDPSNAEQKVDHEAVRPTSVYVQAGAFREFDNANRVNARLSAMGRAAISQTVVDGMDLYRVRLGPLATVDEADRMLDLVIGAGYPDARVVVD